MNLVALLIFCDLEARTISLADKGASHGTECSARTFAKPQLTSGFPSQSSSSPRSAFCSSQTSSNALSGTKMRSKRKRHRSNVHSRSCQHCGVAFARSSQAGGIIRSSCSRRLIEHYKNMPLDQRSYLSALRYHSSNGQHGGGHLQAIDGSSQDVEAGDAETAGTKGLAFEGDRQQRPEFARPELAKWRCKAVIIPG